MTSDTSKGTRPATGLDVDALTEATVQHIVCRDGVLWGRFPDHVQAGLLSRYRPMVEFVAARVEQDVRRQQREAVEAAIEAEFDLHQCSFAELPAQNQVFVMGMRRAMEWMARGGSDD